MPVVRRFREPVEHLEADEVQVSELVIFAFNTACNGVFCRVKYEPVPIRIAADMLHFQHDAIQVLVFCHDIRRDVLTERGCDGRVYERDTFDTVSAVKLENGVKLSYKCILHDKMMLLIYIGATSRFCHVTSKNFCQKIFDGR